MIDPFRLCLALGPVAVYLLLVGWINMFRRPFLISGTRDTAAFGLAVSGLVIVGPMELFVPMAATITFGPFVWMFLVALYALCLVLVLLMLRPRLVIYNISAHELRPILADLAAELDSEPRWAGDSLVLPDLGVRLHMEALAAMRNVSLIATRAEQNYLGWRRLELALGAALRRLEVPRNPRGLGLVAAGLLLGLALMLVAAYDPQTVFRSMCEMLQL